MTARIGIGFDAHAFLAGRKLVLGGVEIPHPLGLQGHSDADVLVHAICDALLGAAGLGDMGRHFPDTDPEFKDISSLLLLAQVMQMISDQGFKAVNIDAVIIAQQPRMSAHMPRMIEAIRRTPGLEGTAVNLKATTTEGLGFTGRKEGIAAQAVTLLRHMQT